jgi:hypothetical protein
MRPIVATALLLSLQAAPLDEFYKFKAGTSWTYKRLEDNQERKLTGTVIGEEGGKVRVEWKDPDKDGTSAVAWSVVDGVLTVEARKEGETGGLSFALLKAGAKKDDTWASPGGAFTHQGKKDVTVPAGTYKDAVWTQFKTGEEGSGVKIDFYLAPKVGLVKIEIFAKDGGTNRFELTEFKEGGK